MDQRLEPPPLPQSTCVHCGKPIDVGDAHCRHCGKRPPVSQLVCVHCKMPINGDDVHCRHCGKRQGPAGAWYFKPVWILVLALLAIGPLALILVWKSPLMEANVKVAMAGFIVVYTVALNLFGIEASFLSLLGYLPVIFFAAAVPTPMRAAAITFWVILFPENEGQMAAFGFVQHNFFILFNALIGVAFWRRAQRELFG